MKTLLSAMTGRIPGPAAPLVSWLNKIDLPQRAGRIFTERSSVVTEHADDLLLRWHGAHTSLLEGGDQLVRLVLGLLVRLCFAIEDKTDDEEQDRAPAITA